MPDQPIAPTQAAVPGRAPSGPEGGGGGGIEPGIKKTDQSPKEQMADPQAEMSAVPDQANLVAQLNVGAARSMIEVASGIKTPEQVIAEQATELENTSKDSSLKPEEKNAKLAQSYQLKIAALQFEQYKIATAVEAGNRRATPKENTQYREIGKEIDVVNAEMKAKKLDGQENVLENFALNLGVDQEEAGKPIPAIADLIGQAMKNPEIRTQLIDNIKKIADRDGEAGPELPAVLDKWSEQLAAEGKNVDSKIAHERLNKRVFSISLLGAFLMYLAWKNGQAANHPQGGYG